MHNLKTILTLSQDCTKPKSIDMASISEREAKIVQRYLNDMYPTVSTSKAFDLCLIKMKDFFDAKLRKDKQWNK